MILSVIAAVAENGVIGRNNQLPWRLSADLKRFKKITMGCPIVMGRKTFESIGKPLPGRRNIVLSRQAEYRPAGTEVFPSLETALAACGSEREVFVIGGANLYKAMLEQADRLYLTRIHKDIEGDAYFPEVNLAEDFDIKEVERFDNQEGEIESYSFIVAERKKKGNAAG